MSLTANFLLSVFLILLHSQNVSLMFPDVGVPVHVVVLGVVAVVWFDREHCDDRRASRRRTEMDSGLPALLLGGVELWRSSLLQTGTR